MISDSKKVQSVFFICIFAVSLFYRFYDLDKRGYFPSNDTAAYANVIKSYKAAVDYIIKSKILRQDIGSMNDYLYKNGGHFYNPSAKFALIPIGLIGSLIFGSNTNTVLYIYATFGVFTVILLFFILLRSKNLFYSFILSLLFAVSPYHIGFSREGNPVIFASFFLLLSVYLYTKFLESNNFRYLYFCGLSLGFGFLCHYNIGPFILVFFIYEIYYFLLKQSNVKRILAISVFAFLPLLLTDIFTRAIKFYGTMKDIKNIGLYQTYFNGIFQQLSDMTISSIDIHAGPFYYFSNFLYHEGIIPSILLVIAVLLIIWRGMKVDCGIGYFLVLIFLLPFFYYLWLQHVVADRAMLSFIPLWYLLIGYGLNNFAKSKYGKIVIFIIMIPIVSNAIKSMDYFNYRSNFEQAVNYMERNKGVKHISSMLSLSRLYVGRENAIHHAESPYSEYLTELRKVIYQINPLSVDKIKSLYNDGYNYLVLNIPPSVSNELTEAAMNIQPEYSTDIMICNDRGDGYDSALLRDKKGKYLYWFNVYDLGKVLNKMGQNK